MYIRKNKNINKLSIVYKSDLRTKEVLPCLSLRLFGICCRFVNNDDSVAVKAIQRIGNRITFEKFIYYYHVEVYTRKNCIHVNGINLRGTLYHLDHK